MCQSQPACAQQVQGCPSSTKPPAEHKCGCPAKAAFWRGSFSGLRQSPAANKLKLPTPRLKSLWFQPKARNLLPTFTKWGLIVWSNLQNKWSHCSPMCELQHPIFDSVLCSGHKVWPLQQDLPDASALSWKIFVPSNLMTVILSFCAAFKTSQAMTTNAFAHRTHRLKWHFKRLPQCGQKW